MKPFHAQHPVRGHFGDPRIGGRISDDPMTRPRSLHLGVDVAAPDGTAVYATITGTARVSESHKGRVAIFAPGGIALSYWHIEPAVPDRQQVIAYRTVIGHIVEGWGHVHFAERRSGVYVNPLRRGAMGPYVDRTCPAVSSVRIERGGIPLEPGGATGGFDIVAEALDPPAMSAPAPWLDLPVTPALLEWRVVNSRGEVVFPWRVGHDARRSFLRATYDEIYAIGTVQNYPNRPGRYRFYLASDVPPDALVAGSYTVEVIAADSAGNRATSSWPLVIQR